MALVDDAELRISLAQKHKCHDIVINVRLFHVYMNNALWLDDYLKILNQSGSCRAHVLMLLLM